MLERELGRSKYDRRARFIHLTNSGKKMDALLKAPGDELFRPCRPMTSTSRHAVGAALVKRISKMARSAFAIFYSSRAFPW
jgi:DNA-binding MarR family transcriptional regulator